MLSFTDALVDGYELITDYKLTFCGDGNSANNKIGNFHLRHDAPMCKKLCDEDSNCKFFFVRKHPKYDRHDCLLYTSCDNIVTTYLGSKDGLFYGWTYKKIEKGNLEITKIILKN